MHVLKTACLYFHSCSSTLQHFEVPLSLTMAHLIVKFIISAFLRTLLSMYLKEDRVVLPWNENLKRIAPTGLYAQTYVQKWAWFCWSIKFHWVKILLVEHDHSCLASYLKVAGLSPAMEIFVLCLSTLS